MKSYTFKTLLVLALGLGLAVSAFAAYGDSSQVINVSATVPQTTTGLDVGFSEVTPVDCTGTKDTFTTLTPGDPMTLAFGTLTFDSTYKIFRAAKYFAVDVGVLDNSTYAWTITHTRTNFAKDASNNLNGNVNVAFMKQTAANPAGTQIYKVSYGDSNSKTVTKSQVSGGWLRIYYGIAGGIKAGDPNPNGCTLDATNVTPITTDKPYGTYSGTVTLTLS